MPTLSLPKSRAHILNSQEAQAHLRQVEEFLQTEKNTQAIVYPTQENIFQALELTAFDDVKVVIIGQDPYHGPHQAMGLSFSVPEGVKIPPSLRNIYKELALEYPGYKAPNSGDLTSRARQGVLLLNAILSVRASEAGSHRKIGRESLTDIMIQSLSQERSDLVFLLRGKFAQSKQRYIDTSKHLVLEAAHPSPLSAYRGRFGCNHFKKTNKYLESLGKKPIQR